MAQKLINRPSLFGFSVQTMSIVEPRIDRFSADPTTANTSVGQIRLGDPVVQMAGGTIVRYVPGGTALLGFAASGQNNVLPRSIASAPLLLDTTGNPLISVYLADALTIFTGQTTSAPTQANVLQLHDLQYAIPDLSVVAPVITNVGVAGTTTYNYQIGALTAMGESVPNTNVPTTTGNAVLSSVNYNLLTIAAVPQAASFNIYRGNALIGNAPAIVGGPTTFKDIGQMAQAGLITMINNTGWLVNNTASATQVLEIRSIDTKPVLPFISTTNVGAVMFAITAAKSQVQNIAGV